jgi:hypothetical protein
MPLVTSNQNSKLQVGGLKLMWPARLNAHIYFVDVLEKGITENSNHR